MLGVHKTDAEKRIDLRQKLASGELLQTPGAFAPMVAMEVEKAGFPVVYISGGVLSADLGLPDIGLTTLTEFAHRGGQIASTTNLPCIIDGDTGFGEAINTARSVNIFERAGLAGCHFEDQMLPKRCGHLDNKIIIPKADMVNKIAAAAKARRDENFVIIARSDARAVEGLDESIDRMQAYVDAGADMIFPEALKDLSEFEAVRKALDVPLLANMTEFGKSELFSFEELQNLGYNMVIYPVTTWRLALGATVRGLKSIKEHGHQKEVLSEMQTRAELYETLQYEDYNQFDSKVFNFNLDNNKS